MKSLIIGGAGFVGAYLAEYLYQTLDQQVYITKMLHEEIKNTKAEVFNLDLLDKDSISTLLEQIQPDCIYHLAAQSSVALSWKNPELTIDVNVKGSTNLLEAVRLMKKQPKVLLIGSGEEYGVIRPEDNPIKEDCPVRPANIYAATKACQNMLGKIYADAYQMNIVMVRAFNHIGPTQAPTFVVSDFCKQVAEIEQGIRKPVIYVGNLDAKRDFTDVRDVVRAYTMIIEKGIPGETYNVGSSNGILLKDLLDRIIKLTHLDIRIEIDPDKLRPIDVPTIEADTTKIRQITKWEREISLEQTIVETLDYWRNK